MSWPVHPPPHLPPTPTPSCYPPSPSPAQRRSQSPRWYPSTTAASCCSSSDWVVVASSLLTLRISLTWGRRTTFDVLCLLQPLRRRSRKGASFGGAGTNGPGKPRPPKTLTKVGHALSLETLSRIPRPRSRNAPPPCASKSCLGISVCDKPHTNEIADAAEAEQKSQHPHQSPCRNNAETRSRGRC